MKETPDPFSVQEESEQEIRRILLAAFGSENLHGGLPPSRYRAKIDVAGHPEAWMLVYGDYMDFSCAEKDPPDTILSEAFASLEAAKIIDWSPGRLACVQYQQADAAALAKTIDALLNELYGLTHYKLIASLEAWESA